MGVHSKSAIGSEQRMAAQNDGLLADFASQRFQTSAQVNLFRRKHSLIEAADFPKRRRLAKNERSRHELSGPADRVPNPDSESCQRTIALQFHRCAAEEILSGLH